MKRSENEKENALEKRLFGFFFFHSYRGVQAGRLTFHIMHYCMQYVCSIACIQHTSKWFLLVFLIFDQVLCFFICTQKKTTHKPYIAYGYCFIMKMSLFFGHCISNWPNLNRQFDEQLPFRLIGEFLPQFMLFRYKTIISCDEFVYHFVFLCLRFTLKRLFQFEWSLSVSISIQSTHTHKKKEKRNEFSVNIPKFMIHKILIFLCPSNSCRKY